MIRYTITFNYKTKNMGSNEYKCYIETLPVYPELNVLRDAFISFYNATQYSPFQIPDNLTITTTKEVIVYE